MYKRQYREMDDETKRKISISSKGKAKSDEHKQHISTALKAYWQSIPSKNDSNKPDTEYDI